MGTEGTSRESAEHEERSVGEVLVSIHRAYIGEPESHQTVYVGFGAFFAGIALGAIALVLVLYSGTLESGTGGFWQVREAALVFGLLALPAVAASVTVLLPVGRPALAASLLGVAVCVVATAWLTRVYPYDWTAAGNDVTVIGVYAVGLVLLAASTGSALVAQYIDRATPRPGDDGRADRSDGAAADDADGEAVSDDQVEADIEEALSESTLTWGGVEREPTTRRLELNTPDLETDAPDGAEIDSTTETRAAGEDVDDAVDGLRRLQGGEPKTGRAESPDDQVDALTEFRREREADDDLETDRGLLGRVRERLF